MKTNLTRKTLGVTTLLFSAALTLTACGPQQEAKNSDTPAASASSTANSEVRRTYYKLIKNPDSGKFGYFYADDNMLRAEAQEVTADGTHIGVPTLLEIDLVSHWARLETSGTPVGDNAGILLVETRVKADGTVKSEVHTWTGSLYDFEILHEES